MKPFTFLAAMSACLLGPSTTVHAQDVEAGEKVFGKCVACHKVGEGASNGFGPVLNDVIGRTAGTYDGFGYSNTLRKAGEAGLVWDEDNISAYITDPKEFLEAYVENPRPRMVFKLKDEQDRKDVIAFLRQFSQTDEADDGDAPMDGEASDEQDGAALSPSESNICVRNASAHTHFFAAEGKGIERRTATLSPGGVLCAEAQGAGWSGVVSVYESATGFEGCSRLVRTGTLEEMRAYADFDRCAWSSNTSG